MKQERNVSPLASSVGNAVAELVRDPLPEYIRQSPLVRRKRGLSREQLADYVERMLVLFTPELLTKFFVGLRKKVSEGDRFAIRLVAEMYHFVQRNPSFTIVNNLVAQQQNNVASDIHCFDDIVRRLERATQAGSQPTPVTEYSHDPVEG